MVLFSIIQRSPVVSFSNLVGNRFTSNHSNEETPRKQEFTQVWSRVKGVVTCATKNAEAPKASIVGGNGVPGAQGPKDFNSGRKWCSRSPRGPHTEKAGQRGGSNSHRRRKKDEETI